MKNLKECPFCGGSNVEVLADEVIEFLEEGEGSGYFAAICNIHKGGCGSMGGYRPSEEEAIEVWNKRVLIHYKIELK